MRSRTHCAVVLALVTLSTACASSPTEAASVAQVADSGASYWPGATWRAADPAAVGLDAARIEAMKRDVSSGRYGAMHGVIVVRYGWVAAEHYVGWSASQPHTMQSVTKSVTSLLWGMASQAVSSSPWLLDRPVLQLFTRYPSLANTDARKQALTVRHLLTMRTSMDFWEQPYAGSPLDEMNRSTGDWTRYILDRPMVGVPGSSWAYNSGAAILIGSAIREITGEQADSYAHRELFGPIGVTGESWFKSPFDGLPHTGGGLNLKPLDLARVGYLVLRRGKWGDNQVVPRAWIDSSTHAVTKGAPVFYSDFGSGYGRFWWLFPATRGGAGEGVIAASGSGGQWLFIVPTLDLVVAIVASSGNGLDLLYDAILPAVRDR